MRAQCLFLEHNKESLFKKKKRYITPFTLCGKEREKKTTWKKGEKAYPPPPLLQAYIHLLWCASIYIAQKSAIMEHRAYNNACVCASVPAFFGRGKERDLLLLVYCFGDIKLCRAKKGTHTVL